MSGSGKTGSVRYQMGLLLIAALLSSCDTSTANHYPVAQLGSGCSFGTIVVLVQPTPGSIAAPRDGTLVLATMGTIVVPKAAVVLIPVVRGSLTPNGASPSPTLILVGPVAPPTASPSPVPSVSPIPSASPAVTPAPSPTASLPLTNPAYYQANYSGLLANQSYSVNTALQDSQCIATPINGAIFTTGS